MKSLLPSEDKSVLRALGGLSPVLSCIRSINDSDDHCFSDFKTPRLDDNCFRFLRNEPCVKNGNGFCMAISLIDGNTLFVSHTISSVLGYPKDMVIGTCIMNYLYPRDRVTFASQLTQGLQSRFCDNSKTFTQSTFYCRIRQYHSLKRGYGVSDKKSVYKPFQIAIRVRDISSEEPCVEDDVQTPCLIAVAVPLVSAYKASEEIPAMSSFSTRHTASCHFSHMDASAIAYLGFLPQDVLGFSIFDFYHMDDMPQLKDIYELVVKEQGCSFRSKPYRLKAFNGSYVVLETEWSCFINPWSRKLEFVLGQHRVLKGPVDANVFGETMKEDGVVSDEILKESQRIQEEIKNLLSQPVKNHVSDTSQSRCPKRKRGLASFVSSLVDVCQGEEHNWAKEDCSCSDRGSVVMGEISPHQEYNGSDPSSATPPTSQEIRYQENIDRFFASHPKTYSSDGSGECKTNFNNNRLMFSMSVDNESGKTSADSGNGSLQTQSVASLKAANNSQGGSSRGSGGGDSRGSGEGDSRGSGEGDSRGSGGGESHGSGGAESQGSGGGESHDNYPSSHSLTTELLSQHNRMIHKYNSKQKKTKTSSSANVQLRKDSHRMKRSSSPHMPDGGPHKQNKSSKCRSNNVQAPTEDSTSNGQSNPSTLPNQMSGFSLNPPFSMASFPSMSHTSTSMPWNSSSVTSSFTNPSYNPGMPNYGVPNYMYMGGAGAPGGGGAQPSPFFMPVMYMGAMPFYPSISPMMAQNTPMMSQNTPMMSQNTPMMAQNTPMMAQNTPMMAQNTPMMAPNTPMMAQNTPMMAQTTPTTVWPFNFGQACSMGMSVPVNQPNQNQNEQSSTQQLTPEVRLGYENMDTNPSATQNKMTWCNRLDQSNCNSVNMVIGNNRNQVNSIGQISSNAAGVPTTQVQSRESRVNNTTEQNQRHYLAYSDRPSDSDRDNQHDDSASMSSSYLLKSDSSQSPSDRAEEIEMESADIKKRPLLKDPPWMDGIKMDCETIYRFQLPSRSLEEILKKDMEALQNLNQPEMVENQLALLQAELSGHSLLRDKQESGTLSVTPNSDGDLENRGAGTSKTDDIPSSARNVQLGFDTLEEDTNEESDSREADMLLYIIGSESVD